MFEDMTYEHILTRCLDRVSPNVDKREGSIIYDAIAPAAAELAALYVSLGTLMDRAFPDTATGSDLTLKASERGLTRQPATPAVRQGEFYDSLMQPMDIPIGARLSGGDMNYIVEEQISPGLYKLRSEVPGSQGNVYFGDLLPIDHIANLGAAILGEVLIPGQDEETDDSLRSRYYESINVAAYGGNIADYKAKTTSIPGVGGVKVFPVWNGGGTVKLVILDSEMKTPSPALVDTVKETMDPVDGDGSGVAPIGHIVTVVGAANQSIDITMILQYQADTSWETVEAAVTVAIEEYFHELAIEWAGQGYQDYLVVRISQIETRVLSIPGIIDITGTTINGSTDNLYLGVDEVPVLGAVTAT